jgi:hypothetical protein
MPDALHSIANKIRRYRVRENRAQLLYTILTNVVIVAAALIVLSIIWSFTPDVVPTWWLGGLALLIIISETLLQTGRFHAKWILYRNAGEALKHEAFLYEINAEPYDEADDPDELFAERTKPLMVEPVVKQPRKVWDTKAPRPRKAPPEIANARQSPQWAQYHVPPSSEGPYAERAPRPERAEVDMSVFSPKSVSPMEPFVIQAVLHRAGRSYEELAQLLARQLDTEADRLAQASLLSKLHRGEKIEMRLIAPDLEIEMPVQTIVWRGSEQAARFVVCAVKPERTQVLGRLQVFRKGLPIGYAVFRINLVQTRTTTQLGAPSAAVIADATPEHSVEHATKLAHYKRAFLSYASADRLPVLRHHQLLHLLGIKVFHDIVSMRPGSVWKEELLKEIDESDLMLVYWSNSAAGSAWVRMEVEYALSLRDKRKEDIPDIVPVILEGPPVPTPPPSLAHLHFNDPMRYIIYAQETTAPRA